MPKKITNNVPVSLSTPMAELEQKLVNETNIDELNNIIDIFNLNLKRKDIVRANKLNELQDKIVNQMGERLDKKADEFSNKDLLDYHKVIQETLNKADNSLENLNTPKILINQQVNINDNKLSRESKERVTDAVKSILAKMQQQENIIEPEEVTILNEEDEGDIQND